MDFVEGILSRFWDEILIKQIIDPLLRDPSYQLGYFWGLMTAVALVIVKFILGRFVYWWNRILQFFKPTKGPADPGKGPTPFEMFKNFVLSLLWVIVAIALLVIIVFVVSRRGM